MPGMKRNMRDAALLLIADGGQPGAQVLTFQAHPRTVVVELRHQLEVAVDTDQAVQVDLVEQLDDSPRGLGVLLTLCSLSTGFTHAETQSLRVLTLGGHAAGSKTGLLGEALQLSDLHNTQPPHALNAAT